MKNPAAPPVTSMMESEQLLERFLRLQIWTANGQRAPHKPLLALWAIGRCLRGEERLAPYEEADRALTTLLRAFGPHRKSIHTEAPFWRLQGDGVWEVRDADRVNLTLLEAPRSAHAAGQFQHESVLPGTRLGATSLIGAMEGPKPESAGLFHTPPSRSSNQAPIRSCLQSSSVPLANIRGFCRRG